MGRLSGKKVLIVGAATGAGRATAIRFAAEGASVAIGDINKVGADEVVATIAGESGTAIAIPVDITNEEDVRSMVRTTVEAFGTIDVLHNNAAALQLLAQDGDITEMDVQLFDDTFAANTRGYFLTCKHVLPLMLKQANGVIINTASMAAVQADTSLPVYSASKAAVMALTRSVATMYGRRGIRCNTIVPNTMMTDRAKAKFSEEDLRLKLSERLLPRVGQPEDLANIALFLASDESYYIQGQAILMDGGDTAHRPSVTVQTWNELGS